MVAPGRDGQIEKAKGSSWGEVGFCVVRGGAGTQWALTNSRLCFSNFCYFNSTPRLNCLFSPQQEQEFISSSIKNRKVGKMFKANLCKPLAHKSHLCGHFFSEN